MAGDGSPGGVCLPFLEASRLGRLDVVHLLFEKGVNLEVATSRDPLPGCEEGSLFPRGTRALHDAAFFGEVDVVEYLLRAGAQPNPKNSRGCTPLIAACNVELSKVQRCVLVVGVLLMAGALPSLTEHLGRVPLHIAAQWGTDDVIEVLAAVAPGTLDHTDQDGRRPLRTAAKEGHESTVRLLLSVGATDKEALVEDRRTSLEWQAIMGHGGVVDVLLVTGLEAVGGIEAVRAAMTETIKHVHPRILDRVRGIEGGEMRAWWAGADAPIGDGVHLLLLAAMVCCLAATSVLLAAGANERVFEISELVLSELIGEALDEDNRDEARVAALGRMLDRGPAFRARSYCWPVASSIAASVTPVSTSVLWRGHAKCPARRALFPAPYAYLLYIPFREVSGRVWALGCSHVG